METTNKLKRQNKEQELQRFNNIMRNFEAFRKNWMNTTTAGGAVILNFTTLGGIRGFETLVHGEHFDSLVKPALLEALRLTLRDKIDFAKVQIRQAEKLI